MGQQLGPEVVCCQPDDCVKGRRAEITFWEDGINSDGLPVMHGCRPDDSEAFVDPEIWGCCRSREEPVDSITNTNIETLSYSPVRYDVNSTIDAERSHSRYSKIVVHSTRARTQRRSKVWEEWLRAATAGRSVTVLMGTDYLSPRARAAKDPQVKASLDVPSKVQATYYLDRALTKLSILPVESDAAESAMQPISIMVDNIQVIVHLQTTCSYLKRLNPSWTSRSGHEQQCFSSRHKRARALSRSVSASLKSQKTPKTPSFKPLLHCGSRSVVTIPCGSDVASESAQNLQRRTE